MTKMLANGRQIINTQEGVSIEIEKGNTAKDMTCYTFVVSGGLINIQNKHVVRVSK